jgi:Arc/MetJ-type ribon-helix-helix transcriptional regulator
MTIQVPQDIAQLIEDAMHTGQYYSQVDVLRDALIRLRQAMELAETTLHRVDEPVVQEKPLTKQALLRHLSEIGLVDHSADTRANRDDADAPLIDAEDEVISEVVIRERLIEWLAGFL